MTVRSRWSRKPAQVFVLLASLVASLVLVSTLVFPSVAAAPKSTVQFVSPDWVAAHVKDPSLRVLDVRTAPLEYISDHLPNAVNIADTAFRGPNGVLPVQYWDTNKLGSIFSKAGVSNDNRVLVYSNGNDVLGATMVAYLLERSGVKNIYVLDGGFAGYKAAGQATTKVFPRYTPGTFVVKDNPAIRVSLQEVEQLIGKPGVVFIDPRPPELFRGEKDIWIRNGHIPGARNIPWPTFTEANNPQENLKNPHKLKSLDAIRQLLAERGIKPTDDIIVTCSTGREATLQYTVLKHLLNYPKVRIYEGSWTEYSTTTLPVATGPEKVLTSDGR
ncbi:sulfurtransferase [Pantanalinema rosaneae]|uniref:sulfurtransferase n=1 Tax=Pantanalinema rosaneae TaxID=1620701 RepID=UPI003D6FFE01